MHVHAAVAVPERQSRITTVCALALVHAGVSTHIWCRTSERIRYQRNLLRHQYVSVDRRVRAKRLNFFILFNLLVQTISSLIKYIFVRGLDQQIKELKRIELPGQTMEWLPLRGWPWQALRAHSRSADPHILYLLLWRVSILREWR